MTEVADNEEVSRLLFYPQMIRDGKLQPNAFPMDELLTKKGKTGSSVDRCYLLSDRDLLLKKKLRELANPTGQRSPFGFSLCFVSQIRQVKLTNSDAQAFDVWPDRITDSAPSKPWDDAHALIKRFDSSYTRSHLRGSRDHLTKLFSEHLVAVEDLEG